MADHAFVLLALPRRFRTSMAIAMDEEQLREWRYPAAGTRALTRLLLLLKYVPVVFFFNVFAMLQKSGFRRSFMCAGSAMVHEFIVMVSREGQRTKQGTL